MTKNLAAYIEDFSKKTPDAIAVVSPEGLSLSYKDFSTQSGAFARFLSEKNINRLVLLADRTIPAYIAVIAAAWQGIAYVPLSLKAPVSRLCDQLKTAKSTAILIDENGVKLLTPNLIKALPSHIIAGNEDVQKSLTDLNIQSVCINNEQIAAPPKSLTGEEEAYIIFTSGSSGTPKGVLLSTGARDAYARHLHQRHEFLPTDRVAQPVDLSWDVSVGNYMSCFSAGATLYLMSAKAVFTPFRFLIEKEITVWHSVPNVADMLFERGLLKENIFPKLRWTDFSGAPLFPKTAQAWQKAAPNSALVNSYGPTEMTVDCLDYTLPANFSGETVPIGTLFEQTKALILKADGTIAEQGEIGELLLSGTQQADGYLDDSEKTEAAFVWRSEKGEKTRWYRTGDLVTQDEQGLFLFKGRLDHQLKVLGYRVETEEVEAIIRKEMKIDQVVVSGYPMGDSSVDDLVCFMVLPPGKKREDYSASGIWEKLTGALPIYMAPRYYYILEAFPHLDNGKMNRKALADYMIADYEI